MNQTLNQTSTLAALRALVPERPVDSAELPIIAERQAALLRRRLAGADIAFDTDLIARQPRIQIRLENDLPTSGMTFWNGHEWIIVLNDDEPLSRQRFSLLHEYHHIISHSGHDRLFGAGTKRTAPICERTADHFAASVLMPKQLVKRYFGNGIQDTADLAQLFEVSVAAMNYRLDQLGLVEQRRRCGMPRTHRAGRALA